MSELDASLPRRSGESGGGAGWRPRGCARVAAGPPISAASCEMVNACASNAAGDARTSTVSSLTATPPTVRTRIDVGGPE